MYISLYETLWPCFKYVYCSPNRTIQKSRNNIQNPTLSSIPTFP